MKQIPMNQTDGPMLLTVEAKTDYQIQANL